MSKARSGNFSLFFLIGWLLVSAICIVGVDRTFRSAYAADDLPIIEIANISGVNGYEIGIFGENFGATEGNVTILGAEADVVEWNDGFVRAVVPTVEDGSDLAGLVLTTDDGEMVSAEFTTYTIDPVWLYLPATTFNNIAFGKPVTLEGVDLPNSQCTNYQTGETINATTFLTNYLCRYDVAAKFGADSSLGTEAIIAVDLETPQPAGSYLFQFFSRSDWSAAIAGNCPGTGYPYHYVVESSADAATWSAPHATVTDNLRGNRSHYLTLPANTRWLRLRVINSIGDCRSDIVGRDFELKEIRLYAVDGESLQGTDAFTIYGDSIAAGAFNQHVGARDVNVRIANSLPAHLPFTPLGYSGRKASQLAEEFPDPNELADAFAEDELAGSALYWGIALGTNDMNLSGIDDPGFSDPNSQFNQFDESIEVDAVQWLIEHGRVPILARMHDTSENGYGFIEAKRKILADTDRIAAQYRLIPGPDFYTEFRLNIERNGASWLASDGTHLANEGPDQWVQMWADSMQRALAVRTEPVPTATNTVWQHTRAVTTIVGVIGALALLGISIKLMRSES